MNEELKPCPFCGASAEMIDADTHSACTRIVQCTVCNVSMILRFNNNDKLAAKIAISNAWNRRADND